MKTYKFYKFKTIDYISGETFFKGFWEETYLKAFDRVWKFFKKKGIRFEGLEQA